jgi:hypothetical protein
MPLPAQVGSPANKILFIVGVQRSGTTLLRNILHAHPDVVVMYDCAFYKILAGKYKGIACADLNIDEFIRDLYAVKRFNYQRISPEELKLHLEDECKCEDYAQAIRCVAGSFREQTKPAASIVGIKNPNGIYHLPFIFENWPDAKVIHIIRDARGIYSSEKKKNLERGGYHSGKYLWTVSSQYQQMTRVFNAYKNDPRVLNIYYERLVSNFEEGAQEICSWLGIDLSDEILNYDRIGRQGQYVPAEEMWQHDLAFRRPSPERLRAYEHELSRSEIESMVLLQNENLSRFGYPIQPGASLFRNLPFILGGYLHFSFNRLKKYMRKRLQRII